MSVLDPNATIGPTRHTIVHNHPRPGHFESWDVCTFDVNNVPYQVICTCYTLDDAVRLQALLDRDEEARCS